jgi:hypothetical protein
MAKALFAACTLTIRTQIWNATRVCIRKACSKNMKKNDVNYSTVKEKIDKNEAEKIVEAVRNSPSYWKKIKTKVMAMVRQEGAPTIFITLSPAEKNWNFLKKALLIAEERSKYCKFSESEIELQISDENVQNMDSRTLH